MIEIPSRARTLPAPPSVVWESLTEPHRPGSRRWLDLTADEVEPRVLEAESPHWIVWTSLWPSRPLDRVRLELSPVGQQTLLRHTLLTTEELRDDRTTSDARRRLSVLLFADLRYSYGQ